jgi:hypothetical protein
VTELSSWTLQVSVSLPRGSSPVDFPALAKLEDRVRSMVSETEHVSVDTFITEPGAIRDSLVSLLDFHTPQPDGSCSPLCGWKSDGTQTHSEHVVDIFEESTRAHALS